MRGELAWISWSHDFLRKLLLLNQAFALFNRHNFIHANASHGVDYAAGPTNLDKVYRSPLLEAEMQPEIILPGYCWMKTCETIYRSIRLRNY